MLDQHAGLAAGTIANNNKLLADLNALQKRRVLDRMLCVSCKIGIYFFSPLAAVRI